MDRKLYLFFHILQANFNEKIPVCKKIAQKCIKRLKQVIFRAFLIDNDGF